jgi:hypothetical protein
MSNGGDVPAGAPPRAGGGGSRAALVVLGLLVLAGVGVGGYLIGRSSADTKKAKAEGRRAGEALYAKGTPRYQAIYRAGFAAGQAAGTKTGVRQGAELGRKVGLEQGQRIGQLQGERQGIVSGANAALGGFSGWQPGAFYIVKVEPGSQGVPFRIAFRKLMQANARYAICANDPADVCTEPTGG